MMTISANICFFHEPRSEIAEKPNLTWLDAAQVPATSSSDVINVYVCKKVEICLVFLVQIVLEEAGRPMHIKEIKQRIIDRGLVQSKYSKPTISSFVLTREVKRRHSEVDKSLRFVSSFLLLLSFSAKSSLEAVMYREVRTMFRSDSSLCC